MKLKTSGAFRVSFIQGKRSHSSTDDDGHYQVSIILIRIRVAQGESTHRNARRT